MPASRLQALRRGVSSVQQRQHSKRKGRHQRRIQRCASHMHLPEQAGGPVVGAEVEQAGVGPALPPDTQGDSGQQAHHAELQRFGTDRRLHSQPMQPQRQQEQGQHHGLGQTQAVQRLQVALPPAPGQPARVLYAEPARQQRGRHQRRQAPQRQAGPARPLRINRKMRQQGPPRIATCRDSQQEDVQLFHHQPASPRHEPHQRQQRQQAQRPARRGDAGGQRRESSRQQHQQGRHRMVPSQHRSAKSRQDSDQARDKA